MDEAMNLPPPSPRRTVALLATRSVRARSGLPSRLKSPTATVPSPDPTSAGWLKRPPSSAAARGVTVRLPRSTQRPRHQIAPARIGDLRDLLCLMLVRVFIGVGFPIFVVEVVSHSVPGGHQSVLKRRRARGRLAP